MIENGENAVPAMEREKYVAGSVVVKVKSIVQSVKVLALSNATVAEEKAV